MANFLQFFSTLGAGLPRVNLTAYLISRRSLVQSRERTYLVFGAGFWRTIGAERGLKKWAIEHSIVLNNRYQLFFAHTGAQNCCAPKHLAQSPGGTFKNFSRDSRVIFWFETYENVFVWVSLNWLHFSGVDKIAVIFLGYQTKI